MELLEMNQLIGETYKNIGLVNSVYNNDPYFVWTNNPKVKYTSFVFDIKNMNIGEDTQTFTYQFTIGDRLLEDTSNYNEIYETNYKIIEKGINQLLKDDRILSIAPNRNYNFLKQKFSDILSICFLEVSITTAKDIGNC